MDPLTETKAGVKRRRWQTAFPFHWDADELVTRRELLRFTIFASGTLFGATSLLAALAQLRAEARTEERLIARAGDLAEGQALYFTYPGPEDQAVLLHLVGGQFVAYSQRCTHLSCAVVYQPEHERLYCPCHEGVFQPASGAPTAGPPRRPLAKIVLRQEGDRIFAVARVP